MTSVAIIFDNFGPYHVARLQAAAMELDLLAIEVAGVSATYSWKNDATIGTFNRVTLVENATSGDVKRSELFRRLMQALDQFKPGVVAVPGWASPAAWGAMLWCLRNGVPMVCLSDSTEWDEPRTFWKEWTKSRLVGLFSAALVAGQRARDYLIKLGMPAQRIFLGYDAVDNAYFSASAAAVRENADQVRLHYELPKNYFMASARFVKKKNLSRLLEAYSLYCAHGATPWSLVLLGDGPLRSDLVAKVDALGLRNHVWMSGFKQVTELPAYYALASAFIHASTEEPWGLVVNEAMACGLPVLVSKRCGCSAELVSEGVNGYTFDPYNVEEMARLMVRLSAPGFPRSAFGKSSEEMVVAWSPERFSRGLSQAVEVAGGTSPVIPTQLERALLWMVRQT